MQCSELLSCRPAEKNFHRTGLLARHNCSQICSWKGPFLQLDLPSPLVICYSSFMSHVEGWGKMLWHPHRRLEVMRPGTLSSPSITVLPLFCGLVLSGMWFLVPEGCGPSFRSSEARGLSKRSTGFWHPFMFPGSKYCFLSWFQNSSLFACILIYPF